MKTFKTLVFTAVLVFSLAFTTYGSGGDVDVPGAKPSPTPQLLVSNQDSLVTYTETQHTEEVTTQTSDYLFYEALAALLSVY